MNRTAAALLVLAALTAPARAAFVGLGTTPGAAGSAATGVSADGSVVVGYTFTTATNSFRAFRWTAGGLQDLGVLPSDLYSLANGVSADGAVVVGESVSRTLAFRAVQSSAGGALQPLPFQSAYDASADGSVVVGSGSDRAVRWTAAGGAQSLGVLPGTTRSVAFGVSADGGVVVGSSGDRAFRWTADEGLRFLGFLPGGLTSSARDVSADGSVVVGISATGAFDRAFRWTEETGLVALAPAAGSFRSEANAVSADGTLVVGLSGGFGDRATVWDAANGRVFDLRDLLGAEAAGWSLRQVTAVSGDAASGYNLVGIGFNPQGRQEGFLVTGLQLPPVPEPPAALMAVAGAAVAGAFALRRRPSTAAHARVSC